MCHKGLCNSKTTLVILTARGKKFENDQGSKGEAIPLWPKPDREIKHNKGKKNIQ